MQLWIRLISVLSFVFATQISAAHTRCEVLIGPPKPVTLRVLRGLSGERVARAQLSSPPLSFDNLEEQAQHEQVSEQGPLALQQQLNVDLGFISTPAPTSPDIATVSLVDENSSFPIHVDTRIGGVKKSTSVYLSLPQSVATGEGKFLIGSNYKTAMVFLHGGGTPTATGKNAMTLGEKMAAMGIPVLAPDMPGHGRATRNPQGLESFERMADWLLQLIDQTIHPNVKIVLAGHSWGGEFAVFMHRLSADPKYARIVHYIALSPPVDVALGGDPQARLNAERDFKAKYKDPKVRARIAPTDDVFISNIIRNGKNADIGGTFANITYLDYSTPPLTVEQQRMLKPLTVVVGENDGLVYVGREEQFARVFGNLIAPSRFIVLGEGTTWESKGPEDLKKTGHGIFDVYIPGTTTPFVYNLLGEIAQSEGVNPPFEASQNLKIVDQFFRNYANFFAFREMLEHHVEYVDSPTPELSRISARKNALDHFLIGISERREKNKATIEAKVQAALQALRDRVGLDYPLTLKQATDELAVPEVTEERRRQLEAYVAEADQVEATFRSEFTDPKAAADIETLKAENAKLLADLNTTFETYDPELKRLNGIKRPNKDEDRQRKELARMSQRLKAIMKEKEGRFGVERDARLLGVRPPEGIADLRTALRELRVDRSPERRAKLQAYVAEFAKVEADARKAAQAEVDALLNKVPRPENLGSIEDVELAKAETDSILTSTYVPKELPQLRSLAMRIGELNDEVRAAFSGGQEEMTIPKLDQKVREFRTRRASLLKKWNNFWKKDAEKSIVVAPGIKRAFDMTEHTLASYTELNGRYEEIRGSWQLRVRGLPIEQRAAALMVPPADVVSARKNMQQARRVYLAAAEELEKLRHSEVDAGNIQGPEGAVNDLKKMSTELRSLADLIRAEEDLLEARRQRYSLAQREHNSLREAYITQMRNAGQPVPYSVKSYQIYEVLNQPMPDLIRMMNEDPSLVQALQNTLSKWDEFLREIRKDNNSKD